MPSEKSLKVAAIILNGKAMLNTAWGKKTAEGIAAMIDGEVLERDFDELTDDQGCVCPKCNQCGGVTARQDAYVNRPIASNGKVNWQDKSDVTTYDDVVYECVLCGESLELTDIETKNNFCIQ